MIAVEILREIKDGSGYITKGELKKAMKKQNKKMTKTQIDNLMKATDTDGDGKISYDEFFASMVNQ